MARTLSLFVTALSLVMLVYFYYDSIIYNLILFLPSIVIRLCQPIRSSSEIQWGVFRPIKTRKEKDKGLPNVILIIADDLGINDLSHGNGVATPRIDSIFQNGVKFNHAYAGHATCAPSRAALFTGRFATRFGFEFTPSPKLFARVLTHPHRGNIHQPIYFHQNEHLVPPMSEMSVPLQEVYLAENLSNHFNYNTYLIGKWHLGETKASAPLARGFDESLTFLMGASKYLLNGDPRIINAPIPNAPIDDFMRWNLPFAISHNNHPKFQPDEYITDYLSNEAAKLIETVTSVPDASPFFITLAYNAPHSPLQALKSDYEDPEVAAIPSHTRRVYAAMIKALDRGVGKVLDALQECGQWENTIVIFTSDNGGASYIDLPHINRPYRGWKATFFEGGLRIPLFMQWPQMIPASTILDQAVSHVDIFPTVFAAASLMIGANREEEAPQQKPLDLATFPAGNESLPREVSQSDELWLRYTAPTEETGGLYLTSMIAERVGSVFSSLQSCLKPVLSVIVVKVRNFIASMEQILHQLIDKIHVSRDLMEDPVAGKIGITMPDSANSHMIVNEAKSVVRQSTCLNRSWILFNRDILNPLQWFKKAYCAYRNWLCHKEKQNIVNSVTIDPQNDISPSMDGIDLLPYILSTSNPVSLTVSRSGAANAVSERVLFWRSGHYKCIYYSNWKLQVSLRPDKIWFFDLLNDPTEQVNIAEQLQIQSMSEMQNILAADELRGVKGFHDKEDLKIIQRGNRTDQMILLELFQRLLHMDSKQHEALWPALVEVPLLVDKTSNSNECEGDEYIYWAN